MPFCKKHQHAFVQVCTPCRLNELNKERKPDVKMSHAREGVLFRPLSDEAFQAMAVIFFEDVWVWDGNTLVVPLEKADAVQAILEDTNFRIA